MSTPGRPTNCQKFLCEIAYFKQSQNRQAEEANVNYTILSRDELQRDGSNYEFEGYLHGDTNTNVSFIWVDLPPGGGPRLHKHPYEEIIVIQEGQGTFTIGPMTLEARAGQVVIIPLDSPHKFFNSGEGPLRQIDIHLSKQISTQWLED
jgi:mannose-6-phosphate isomerase-like protein (cupin superfamily)